MRKARSISWRLRVGERRRVSTACRSTRARVTLERERVEVPERIESDGIELVPFHAGETLGWKLVD